LAEPRRALDECNWHFVSPWSGTASSIAATCSKDDPREQKDSVERKNFMPVSMEDGDRLLDSHVLQRCECASVVAREAFHQRSCASPLLGSASRKPPVVLGASPLASSNIPAYSPAILCIFRAMVLREEFLFAQDLTVEQPNSSPQIHQQHPIGEHEELAKQYEAKGDIDRVA